MYDEYSNNFTNSIASVILLYKGVEVLRHTSKDEKIMGNLFASNSNFLNKHDLASNGTVLTITNVEYKNAEVGSKFDDQWILTLRDARTQVDLGVIGLPSGNAKRNETLKTLATMIEQDGEYGPVILKEIPSRTTGFNPFFAINDFQGALDADAPLTKLGIDPEKLDNHPF